MGGKRSPNFPSLSLKEAVEYIKKAYPKAGRHKSDKESIVKLFGYKSLNGASLTLLGTLNQYGLLEGRKENIGISTDGEAVAIDPQGSKSRLDALERCLVNAAVFADLISQYGESLPADEIVRPYLIRKGFSPASVDSPIRALRDSLEFVKEERRLYNGKIVEAEGGTERAQPAEDKDQRHGSAATLSPPKLAKPEPKTMTQDSITLEEGQVVLQFPTNLSASSVEYLEMWLQLQLKMAKERLRKQSIKGATAAGEDVSD